MQQKRWLDQQIAEKNEHKLNDTNKKNMYDTMQADINTKWGNLDDEYEQRRLDMRVATKNTLNDQAKEKLERDALDK